MKKPTISRRSLLAGSASAGFGVVAFAGAGRSREISGGMPWQEGQHDAPAAATDLGQVPGFVFLTPAEAETLDAAVERLIPSDDLGPGAREAGVTIFIDRQLGGAYGRAERWYMQGPWRDGAPTQGYQSRLSPAGLYRTALAAMDDYARKNAGARSFAGMDAEARDRMLAGMEKGEVELQGVSSKEFFELLLQNCVEGFFSDPIYGGNRDMVGWKLIGFPGARYDYRPYVDHGGKPLKLPPVGLAGRPGWTPKG